MNMLPSPQPSSPSPLDQLAARRRAPSGRLLVTSLLMLASVFAAYVFLLPQIAAMLKDARIQTPELTRWILNLPPARVRLLLELLFAVLIAKELVVPSRPVKLAANMAAWLISAAMLITLLLALVLPIRQVLQTIYQQ